MELAARLEETDRSVVSCYLRCMKKPIWTVFGVVTLMSTVALAHTQNSLDIIELGNQRTTDACQALASSSIGLNLKQVQERAEMQVVLVRVTRNGDTRFLVTMDFLPDRLNLELERGKVTSASCG